MSRFAVERAPIFVLPLPGAGAPKLQFELISVGKHARVRFFDELTTALGNEPIGKIAQAVDTSSNAIPRLEHDDIPSGAMKLVRGGKTGQPRTDDCNCSVV